MSFTELCFEMHKSLTNHNVEFCTNIKLKDNFCKDNEKQFQENKARASGFMGHRAYDNCRIGALSTSKNVETAKIDKNSFFKILTKSISLKTVN